MNDFLATLAAQALSLAPVARPLVPARYAPMPPIGGVGTLEGLRAGVDLAAPAQESFLPSLDRFDAPPYLAEQDAHNTAYSPFSYLQLQQAGVDQAVAVEPGIEPPALAIDGATLTGGERSEPALDAAQHLTTLAVSAHVGEPIHLTTDATNSLVLQQPAAATVLMRSTRLHPIEDATPQRDLPAATPWQATVAPSLEASHNPGSDAMVALPPAASPTSSGELAQQAGESHSRPVLPPEIMASPFVRPSSPMDAARPSAVGEDSTRLASTPPIVAVPAAEAMPEAPRPEVVAPPPAAGPLESNGAVPTTAPLTTLAMPGARTETLPHPTPDTATPVSAGSGAPTKPLQAVLPGQSTSLAPRPEVVASSPVARPSQMERAGPPSPIDTTARVVLPPPNALATPATTGQPAAAAGEHSAVAANSVTSPRPAVAEAPEAPADLILRPQAVQSQPVAGATPTALPPEVVAPSPAARSLQAKTTGSLSNGDDDLRVLPTLPAAVVQRFPAGSPDELPAQASTLLGAVSGVISQPASLARHPASMARQPSRPLVQAAADRSDQAPGQPAPTASVKLSSAAHNAPAAMLSSQKEPDVAQVASTGREAMRGQPAGEQAVVRPVLPAGNDSPASQGNAGRNMPAHEPASLPTIRVTIGRIEVRSSTPARPPAANPPGRPRPALSLDEYLKRPAKVRP